MAIQTVRANVNGNWYNLTYNDSSGAWEATITAPGATSFNQPGGYYNVQVEATNTAGTQVSADGCTIPELQFVVKETVAPVITIISPASGAYVTNNLQPVVFTITDESGGSGVDLDSVVVKLDGVTAQASTITNVPITNGYSFTYTPATPMGDGSHTVTVDATDNDGNAAAQQETTFTVDTIAPSLNVTSPANGTITNTASAVVTGTTNDATSSPVIVSILLNGTDQGTVTVEANGSFSKSITLSEILNLSLFKNTKGENAA